jgi:hypothetical protein
MALASHKWETDRLRATPLAAPSIVESLEEITALAELPGTNLGMLVLPASAGSMQRPKHRLGVTAGAPVPR